MSPDVRDMLFELKSAGVEFLIVGAHALAAHGHPRATGDIDIWVRATSDNADRVMRALARFGAPMTDLSASDFSHEGVVVQLGLPPNRIDLMTSIDGVDFDEAWSRKLTLRIAGQDVPVLGRMELVRNKRATGRPKDVLDADLLESDAAQP